MKERSHGGGKFLKLLYSSHKMPDPKLSKILVLNLFQINHNSAISRSHYFLRVLIEKTLCVCFFTFPDLLQVPLVFARDIIYNL